MWNELERYKNQYLQWELPHLPAEDINKMVKKEHQIFKEKKKREKCYTPSCDNKNSTYFDDRAQLAYGFYALPKLMRELCQEDSLRRYRALVSLTEFLRNPLNAQRAIIDFDIVRRVTNTFIRIKLKYREEYKKSMGKMLELYRTLSFYLNGAEKIVLKDHLMDLLYKLLLNKHEEHHEIVSEILRNLSEKPEVLLTMLDKKKPYMCLSKIFSYDVCAPDYPQALWIHLGHFIELSPEVGIEHGFFEILHRRIVCKMSNYHRMNMKCFALLLRCPEGQRRFNVIDGVQMLYDISSNEYIDSYEYLMLALLHGLQSKRALWRAREFTDLPDIVMRVGRRTTNTRLQLYCLQTMRQLSQIPCVKRYIADRCLRHLSTMNCLNKLNECTRDELKRWLEREIYETKKY